MSKIMVRKSLIEVLDAMYAKGSDQKEAAEVIRTLEASLLAEKGKVEALEKDARRYRWLRDEGDKTWRPLALNPFNRGEIDRAIDNALATTPAPAETHT